tara:strand:- start:3717 stop:4322 length:606 start_codon:yes stop_codon:yes gene_type:complete
MKMNNSKWPGLLLGLLLLAGCGGAPSVIKYYVIDPVPMAPVATLGDKSVQILDLKLPQYLERFQIARREEGNRITFNNNQQWGENLRKNLFRTMTRNLSVLLGTADVGTAISRSFSVPDYSLRVSIEAFEQGNDGRVQLAARYQISDGAGSVLATEQVTSIVDRNSGDRYGDMVTDLQQLFADLSRAIAVSIQTLEAQHGS